MWRWYWRLGLGVLAVYIVVGAFAALVGGAWWEPGLAAEWWLECMVVVGLVLAVAASVRRSVLGR